VTLATTLLRLAGLMNTVERSRFSSMYVLVTPRIRQPTVFRYSQRQPCNGLVFDIMFGLVAQSAFR
jgi:hypothetical protein